MKVFTQKYRNRSEHSYFNMAQGVKNTFISLLVLLTLTATASANDISIGKYVGKWKDTYESWNGRFILVIESVTDDSIAGTIRFTNAGRCTRTDAFETPYSGQNHLDFRIKTGTHCEYFHIILDYDKGYFSGTYKDQLGSGKLTKVKLK